MLSRLKETINYFNVDRDPDVAQNIAILVGFAYMTDFIYNGMARRQTIATAVGCGAVILATGITEHLKTELRRKRNN